MFVTDALFGRVYLWADQPTKDAMDLAHLAGQRPGDSLRMSERDIKVTRSIADGAEVLERELWVQQGKTGARLRVRIIGRLAEVVDRILERKKALKLRSFALVVNERGQALTASALDGRFGKARELAGVAPMDFQFRDLRAKAGTETEDARGMEAAQGLLGHAGQGMTRKYVRHRLGKLVDPTK